jgi:hypothetical protein
LNTKQSEVVDLLKRLMVQRNSFGQTQYEVKASDLNDLGHVVSVSISVGLVDETESARAFLREHRHFFVGRRGGVELLSVDAFNRFESTQGKIKGIDNAVRYLPAVSAESTSNYVRKHASK